MVNNKTKKQEPLTLDGLVKYNQDVLFPYFKETFAGKKEFTDFKNEMTDFKNEMTDFKNENLTGQDKILKKLDILLIEKDVRDYQDKKQKKLFAIMIKSLKEHNILSSKELEEITKLEFF
ncbi:MAG: hypothetical protein AAB352_02370 [Patescibacteria group bacterium]